MNQGQKRITLATKLRRPYKGVAKIFGRYWRTYGGSRALLVSPYLHVSVVLLCLLYPIWFDPSWWELPISVMPSVLGFSLGGYAIWLAIGDDRFRQIVAKTDEGEPVSMFMSVNASFVHFIVLQFASILLALLGASVAPDTPMPSGPAVTLIILGGIGFLVFLYALMAALAALMAIFRMASLYEVHINHSDDGSGESK